MSVGVGAAGAGGQALRYVRWRTTRARAVVVYGARALKWRGAAEQGMVVGEGRRTQHWYNQFGPRPVMAQQSSRFTARLH